MVWTDPTGVGAGEMIDAAWMNTYVRDNFDALSTHAHSGAAGDGSNELTGLASSQHEDDTPPSFPGADKLIIYAFTDGIIHVRAGASGSGRTMSLEGHTH